MGYFFIGLFTGAILAMTIVAIWSVGWPGHHNGKRVRVGSRPYPRKTSMPPVGKIVPKRPTNVDQPPSTVRRAIFRSRRETRD